MLLGEIYIEREQYARALDTYQRARALAERMLLVEPDRQQIAARLRFLYRQGATTR